MAANQEIAELWAEVARLRARINLMETREGGGGGGVSDHGALSGLADDDHTQYLNETRHDTTARHGATVVDHGAIGGLADDDHPQYALLAGRSGGQTLEADEGLAIRRSDAGMLLDLGDGAITESGTVIGTGFQRGGTDGDVTLNIIKPDTTGVLMATAAAGDSFRRFMLRSDGNMYWGSGSAVWDTLLGRSDPDVLYSPDRLAAHGYGLTGTKTNIASGSATALADIVVSPVIIMYAMLVGLTVSGSGVASGQLWAVTGGWSVVGINKLSEGLFGHSSITLTGSMTTGTRTLRLTVTQTTGSGVPCTVKISLLPLMGGNNIISSMTML